MKFSSVDDQLIDCKSENLVLKELLIWTLGCIVSGSKAKPDDVLRGLATGLDHHINSIETPTEVDVEVAERARQKKDALIAKLRNQLGAS